MWTKGKIKEAARNYSAYMLGYIDDGLRRAFLAGCEYIIKQKQK
jgi:hypothetical protein